jgi:hypothetical protein
MSNAPGNDKACHPRTTKRQEKAPAAKMMSPQMTMWEGMAEATS